MPRLMSASTAWSLRWQFRLRTLLLFMIPMSLTCAWLGYTLNEWRAEQAALGKLESLGNLQSADVQSYFGAPFARVNYLAVRGVLTDESMDSLSRLRHVTVLQASATQWTDKALEQLPRLTTLRLLDASHSDISDYYVDVLARLPALCEIHLQGSQVTEAGVSQLRELRPDLEILDD